MGLRVRQRHRYRDEDSRDCGREDSACLGKWHLGMGEKEVLRLRKADNEVETMAILFSALVFVLKLLSIVISEAPKTKKVLCTRLREM